ncbi:uncharacterized protein LOC113353674 [Papaver somniferum]|uniref:uncharacterized protein LOC113353674 n=1 Tax=Papaver somniferum TaxID=3469 RepID=UPI000E6F5AEA|nr:uncharacterized protein LOC113353674 [Papaver somniferum]XP_026452987.1 uncharacterized protein LOC113353674 [Papaver somniferum]
MEKDAAKVAKLTRKNAQDAKVQLFNDFCDSRGIPRVPLDLEIFSDDEPVDEVSDDEGTETDGDFEIRYPKGKAPLITEVSDIPSSSSNPLNQPRGTGNIEAESVDVSGGNLDQGYDDGTAEAKNGSAGNGDIEGKAILVVPIHQLPLQS